MKKIAYWEAEDGTRFDTEQGCYEYEHMFDNIKEVVFFGNKAFDLMDKGDLEINFNRCWGFYASSEEQAKLIDKALEHYGIETLSQSNCDFREGLYYYDNSCWNCLETEIENLQITQTAYKDKIRLI